MQPAGSPAEPAIGDYGLIGDMRTAALTDRWGTIAWLCWPRFDSDPVFRRLLDPAAGGYWQLAPAVPFESHRRYLPDTNVLETTFVCSEGSAVATDFMALPADDEWGSQVIRIVEGRSGSVPMRMTVLPTCGFGSEGPRLALRSGRVLIRPPLQPQAGPARPATADP